MTAQVSAHSKAAVVWVLKEHGDIVDETGRARSQLIARLRERGVNLASGTVSRVLAVMHEEGVIDRGVTDGMTRSIRLLNGEAFSASPFEDDSPYGKPRQYGKPRPVAQSTGLDAAIAAIEKLSVPERLMLVGQIIDDCAGEVDEKFSKLRSLLGDF